MIKNLLIHFLLNLKFGGELHFDIKDIDVAKYLNIKLDTLRNRLQNKFSKTKRYFEKVDYRYVYNHVFLMLFIIISYNLYNFI